MTLGISILYRVHMVRFPWRCGRGWGGSGTEARGRQRLRAGPCLPRWGLWAPGLWEGLGGTLLSLPPPPGPQARLLFLPGPFLSGRVALHASCLSGRQLRPVPGRQVSPLPAAWEGGGGAEAGAGLSTAVCPGCLSWLSRLRSEPWVPCSRPPFSLSGPVSVFPPCVSGFCSVVLSRPLPFSFFCPLPLLRPLSLCVCVCVSLFICVSLPLQLCLPVPSDHGGSLSCFLSSHPLCLSTG